MSGDYESGFLARYYTAADGLKLYARDYGHDNSRAALWPTVICLPGLTRNSRDFHQLALILSRHPTAPRRVVALDFRGRGNSAWDDNKQHYNPFVEAEDVVSACAAFDLPKAAFIGTSRGGLVLHVLAQSNPAIVQAAILNDIGPVLDVEGLRDIRDYLNRGRKPSDWEDAVRILKEDHGQSFPILAQQDWDDMAHAIYRETDGSIVADVDPAIALIMKSIDLDGPQRDLWPQFDAFAGIPLMVIRGENSKLLSLETVAEMGRRHRNMRSLAVPGQGHPPILHLAGIPTAIQKFLAQIH
jgi:pimeloyl-ACP methyl ester carboxylesterase